MNKIIISILITSTTMYAEGAFNIGHKHFNFHISQDNDYTVIGGSVNYYVVNNLSLGATFTTWLGNKPTMNRLTIPVTYYLPMDSSIRPYFGLFTSYTLMSNDGNKKYNNYSSFGGRAGVVVDVSDTMYTYAGWVQTKHNGTQVVKSTEGYPEFGFGMSF